MVCAIYITPTLISAFLLLVVLLLSMKRSGVFQYSLLFLFVHHFPYTKGAVYQSCTEYTVILVIHYIAEQFIFFK